MKSIQSKTPRLRLPKDAYQSVVPASAHERQLAMPELWAEAEPRGSSQRASKSRGARRRRQFDHPLLCLPFIGALAVSIFGESGAILPKIPRKRDWEVEAVRAPAHYLLAGAFWVVPVRVLIVARSSSFAMSLGKPRGPDCFFLGVIARLRKGPSGAGASNLDAMTVQRGYPCGEAGTLVSVAVSALHQRLLEVLPAQGSQADDPHSADQIEQQNVGKIH